MSRYAPGTSPEQIARNEALMQERLGRIRSSGGKGGTQPQQPMTSGGKGGALTQAQAQPVSDTYTQGIQTALSSEPIKRRPDPIMPTMMGQPTPAPEASTTSSAEPTLTPSQLMGVVQSMGGKGGFGYRPPSFNPYAGQGGFGYQSQGYMGNKGGYRPPSYNPYATQSPYVNYNQPSYGPASSMGGKGGGGNPYAQPQQPMTSGGKGGSMGGKGGTAGGKGG